MQNTGIASSTPLKESKRSRDMVSPINPGNENPEKKVCGANEPAVDEPPNSLCPQSGEQSTCISAPMHPNDVMKIATELKALMLPEINNVVAVKSPDIKGIIEEAVKEAVGAVKQIYDSQLSELKAENAILSAKCEALEQKINKCEKGNDELEQYSRRNCLRVSGVPFHEGESTDAIVLDIAKHTNANITISDIDRSHRVGEKATKDIIVKFSTYRARKAFISTRSTLKNCPESRFRKVYINEDLTSTRSKILYQARLLVKSKKLLSAYSLDGKIFATDIGGTRRRISCLADLDKYA